MIMPPLPPVRLTVLCGNPKPRSRTLAAAVELSESLLGKVPDALTDPEVIDLALLAPQLFGRERSAVDAALRQVSHSDVLVVATPVYKGSYTGLLKAFLDLLPHAALRGTVAVPMAVMAAPQHALAADLHLRPLLLELGATVPTPSVVLTEAQLADGSEPLAAWTAENGEVATASARLPRHHRADVLA
jgi:FMN reductase